MSSLPRQHSNPYASASSVASPYSYNDPRRGNVTGGSGLKMPRIFKRLFKFPQMDFEMAVWEMSCLIISPRKVWRQVMYRIPANTQDRWVGPAPRNTKNTYATHDPAFPYLLSFFLLLTSLAWSLAYAAPSATNIIRIAFVFIFVHFLAVCLVAATVMYWGLWWLVGPNGVLLGRIPGRAGRGRRGLFGLDAAEAKGEWEFGYCFDVAVRSFFPLWVDLYVIQFVLLPAVTSHRWASVLLSNTLHLIAFSHSTYTTFLGYQALPSLSSTHLLLAPIFVYAVIWLIACVAGWSASLNLAPVLWCFSALRKSVG